MFEEFKEYLGKVEIKITKERNRERVSRYPETMTLLDMVWFL